jgi:hypothetical protein
MSLALAFAASKRSISTYRAWALNYELFHKMGSSVLGSTDGGDGCRLRSQRTTLRVAASSLAPGRRR